MTSPEGWKLVPMKASQEQLEVGIRLGAQGIYYNEQVYEAMLAAAPEPPKSAHVPIEAYEAILANGDASQLKAGLAQAIKDLRGGSEGEGRIVNIAPEPLIYIWGNTHITASYFCRRCDCSFTYDPKTHKCVRPAEGG